MSYVLIWQSRGLGLEDGLHRVHDWAALARSIRILHDSCGISYRWMRVEHHKEA